MANYKETDNYNLKYPNTGDLTTIGTWGETINETLQDIDTLQYQMSTDMVGIISKVNQTGSDRDDIESDLLQASGVAVLGGQLDDVEAVSPVLPATQTELDNLVTSNETKYYSTLPTLIAAATDTDGLTEDSAAPLKNEVNTSYGNVFNVDNGAVQSITYELLVGYLTKVEVWVTRGYGTIDAGFEDEIDANGGTNLADFTQNGYDAGVGGYKMTVDTSSLLIDWNNKYNYRIGGANMYQLIQVILYKDGVISESQTGIIGAASGLQYREGHTGFNIDPSNRNNTTATVINPVSYPKSID